MSIMFFILSDSFISSLILVLNVFKLIAVISPATNVQNHYDLKEATAANAQVAPSGK